MDIAKWLEVNKTSCMSTKLYEYIHAFNNCQYQLSPNAISFNESMASAVTACVIFLVDREHAFSSGCAGCTVVGVCYHFISFYIAK